MCTIERDNFYSISFSVREEIKQLYATKQFKYVAVKNGEERKGKWKNFQRQFTLIIFKDGWEMAPMAISSLGKMV